MTRILFICLGNICRSPSAEAVFESLLKEKQLENRFECDSAGLSGEHSGEKADPRMRKHASARGYQLESIARPFNPKVDFQAFDYWVVMEPYQKAELQAQASPELRDRVLELAAYCREHSATEVPDPYYDGEARFEEVLDLLEDSCKNLLDDLLEKEKQDAPSE